MPRRTLTTADEDRRSGTMPDRAQAQRLGCSRQSITERRRRLRVPLFHPNCRPWSLAGEELLGTMSDRRLVRQSKRSVESVQTRRASMSIPIFNPQKHQWRPADDKLTSERLDEQIAMLLRISREAVRHRRRRLGIMCSQVGKITFVQGHSCPRRMRCWAGLRMRK